MASSTTVAAPAQQRLPTAIRSTLYLCASGGTALATLLAPPLLVVSVLLVAVFGAGLPVLPHAFAALHRWAGFNRKLAADHLGVRVQVPDRPMPAGLKAQLRHTFGDPLLPRRLAWVAWHIGPGIVIGMLALAALLGVPGSIANGSLWWLAPEGEPATLMGLPVTDWPTAVLAGTAQAATAAALLLWGMPPLARLHARVTLALLSPSKADRLAQRVETLTETRAGALDSHAAELRRIERDLHDGTQARLVALAMRLGLAERIIGKDPETAAELLREAQGGAEEAMTELRDVIRTIYPPILADRGLAGAAASLAARSVVPVRLTVADDLGTVPAAVESTAYFVIAESLTNAAKHAAATQILVRVSRTAEQLNVQVIDDGVGGVDESHGTGVGGMRRRVAALDGTLTVTSPEGGPTGIEVELPCGS
ncbi:sensor histidine kinase [Nocardiopsis sediminis]|uniref:histidine kinase n=1 Tax=Nocardiopsis sediminis TaxID=1778267 RepID=A0ABV8FJX6_9ACTN